MKIRTDGTPIAQFSPGDDSLRDLTFDGTHVWAVNTLGTLRKFTVGGELVDTIGGLLSSGAWGLTNDPEGYMWVSNEFTDSLYMISSQEAVSEGPGLNPSTLSLSQNAPNPFFSRTQISFSLSREGLVNLDVFDASGARVRGLLEGRMPSGLHTSTWDGKDEDGNRTPSGVYFYRLKTEEGQLTRRMIHLSN
jgi:hypothetical protein